MASRFKKLVLMMFGFFMGSKLVFADTAYISYVNSKYGCAVDVPTFLGTETESDAGDGAQWKKDGVELTLFSSRTLPGETAKDQITRPSAKNVKAYQQTSDESHYRSSWVQGNKNYLNYGLILSVDKSATPTSKIAEESKLICGLKIIYGERKAVPWIDATLQSLSKSDPQVGVMNR